MSPLLKVISVGVLKSINSSKVPAVGWRELDDCPLVGGGLSADSRPVTGDLGQSERRVERVRFETDRHWIVGDMTLPAQGHQSRLSDSFNRGDIAFIPLVDVEIAPLAGGEVERHEFVVLSKAHVRVAFPADPTPR
jgi:hypothetical protein